MSWKNLSAPPSAIAQLRRSIRSQRLAQAYLFTGPRGSGREEVVRALAQTVNCAAAADEGCGRCVSCRQIAADKHPDVYWVRPESKSRRIVIEQIREFCRVVSLKASTAAVKFGVIVDADCMTEEASNAFLKTLEEPPGQTTILLLSTSPQRLLPTILSRCLRVSFGATGALAVPPQREKIEAALAQLAGRWADPVPAAYGLAAQLTGLLTALREETRSRIEAETSVLDYAELEPKVREKLEEQMAARIEGEYRAAREQILEEMYGWFADLLLCVRGADESLLVHRSIVQQLRQAAAGVSEAAVLAQLAAIEQLRDWLTRNIPEAVALEVGLLRLAQHSR
jgi:DNA polymerase-3 subunit delta'